ncbi:MAG: class I SAM-dependent RNA methyltransferase [Acidobacteriota bacterium]
MTIEQKCYSIGDELDVRIEKIVPRGLGLAFAEKLTIFVPLAAPGDHVRVRINDLKKRTAFAEIVEVIEASPVRTEPPCPYFGICGGCDFQQLTYEAQLAAKVEIIRDCLHRLAKIEFAGEIRMIPSPKPLEYRSRAKWHVDRDARKLGYFKRYSHEVIDVDTCPILTPTLQGELTRLRSTLEWNTMWSDRLEIEAASGDGDQTSVYSAELLEQTREIEVTAHDDKFGFSAQSFFQGNQLLIGKLIDSALTSSKGDKALDLYCGVGLFAIPMARRFAQVIGVEGNSDAIGFARMNARSARFDNLSFVSRSVGEFLESHELSNTDMVLLDPPRSGTEKNVIRDIARLKPKQIAYVSCEPSILARDLAVFITAGYKIDNITALDLFPQTHHVETVARLSRA